MSQQHPLVSRLQSGIHYDAGQALTELVRAWLTEEKFRLPPETDGTLRIV